MLSTNPVALILHDFSSIRCCLGGGHFLSPCPGPPQVNDHHWSSKRRVSLQNRYWYFVSDYDMKKTFFSKTSSFDF